MSVIIPVFNDAGPLAECLKALARQTFPADRTHVLVVDNGSTQDIGAVVARELPSAVVLHESTPGSYAARNRGLASATGDILAFTDADCQPNPDWLEQGVAALKERPDVGLVGGEVEVFPKSPGRPTGAELYDMTFGLRQRHYIEKMHFGVTANLFTRRSVVDRVGPFSSQLKSSGDYEWGQRVWAAGFAQLHWPAARVRHPARGTLRQLFHKARRVAGGRIDSGQLKTDRRARTRRWIRLALPPRDLQPHLHEVRTRYGRRGATRFYCAAYLTRMAMVVEEARLALGGASRR